MGIKGAFRRIVRGMIICVVLAGAGIFAVQFVERKMKPPEPVVDVGKGFRSNSQPAAPSGASPNKLRFAVATMVSVEETFSTYRQFIARIARDVRRDEAFVLHPSYKEARLALANGQVDAAFVCTGTYLQGLESKSFNLLVQPEFADGREYRGLLVVATDSQIRTWDQLRNKVMAYTDPESFTGCLLPSAELVSRGQNPKSYFENIVYTGSHDRSIDAVSSHVTDAAAVMSLVWQSDLEKNPSLAKQMRIIWQSPVYGPPLIVASKNIDRNLEAALRNALLTLHEDDDGRKILAAIGIKRFVPVRQYSYATAREVYRRYQKWLSDHD